MKKTDLLIQSQKDFFKSGQTKTYAFRKKQLDLLYQGIVKYQKEIEISLYEDLNKVPFEAYSTEIGFVLNSIRYTKKHLKNWLKGKTYLSPFYLFGSYDTVSYQPLGISLIIGPFNYPFQLVIEPLIGAIAAGNTAIVKPSENAPATAKMIEKIIQEIYPPDYISCILGGEDITIDLTHGSIDHIFFTGSSQVGKKIMAAASEQLTPVTLELGGKSPVIVDKTANLKDAVEKIAWGKILNAGQTCVAPDYLIIEEELKGEFIALWKKTIDAFLKEDEYPKIINQRHFNRLTRLFDYSTFYSGGHYNKNTLKIEPSLVDGKNSPFMNEEIFGPILPILTFHHDEDILSIVDHYPYPLALYIFSNDKKFISSITKNISFGGACINDCITHLISHKVPFGGIRYSGMGQYHGKESFKTFSHQQTIHHRFLKKDIVSLYPPYSKHLYALIKKVLR